MSPFSLFNFGMTAIVIVVLAFYFLWSAVKVLPEWERAVVLRWGRVRKPLFGRGGTGLILIIPLVDRLIRVSLRTVAMDVPAQDVITKDNVSAKVNAVIFFNVVHPEKAILNVEDYLYATSQISQTTLRSVLGQSELDELLAQRDKINQQLQRIIDEHTDPWGVKVTAVEVKHVDLPAEMQRAMAKQAESEREKRAKIIHASGELEASRQLTEAAHALHAEPIAVQLRYLQTLTEIAAEKNSTIIFPVPIEFFKAFMRDEGR